MFYDITKNIKSVGLYQGKNGKIYISFNGFYASLPYDIVMQLTYNLNIDFKNNPDFDKEAFNKAYGIDKS